LKEAHVAKINQTKWQFANMKVYILEGCEIQVTQQKRNVEEKCGRHAGRGGQLDEA